MRNNYRIDGEVCYIECHSKGKVVEVMISLRDLPRAEEYPLKWCVKDSGDGHYYCFGVLNKKVYYLHRWILSPSPNNVVDHINNNGLDNRRENIREVSPSENALNNSSDGVGFRKDIKKWRARVYVKGKEFHLGHFDTKDAASKARSDFIKKRDIIKESKEVKNYAI